MPLISPLYDIFSLIERYANIQYHSSAIVGGVKEIHSNCPWCPGSEDSFIMRPETGQYSHAIRAGGCGRTGDCLDFMMEFVGMSRAEAIAELGLENVAWGDAKSATIIPFDAKERPPCKVWQEMGKMLIERAEKYLWSPPGTAMLVYLHGRGLGDEIIKKKRLGYVPLQPDGTYFQGSFVDWGLAPAKLSPAQQKKGCVRVPNGILIPWLEGDILWKIAIKRPGEKVDYGQVTGSGEGLYNVGLIEYKKAAMLVESEFCAMAVEQEAGDLISCVATGSTSRARTGRWIGELTLPPYVLQSFDEDKAGDAGAEYWCGERAPAIKRCMRWSPFVAKDPNDILMRKFHDGAAPCTLREWIECGVEAAFVAFAEQPAEVVPVCHEPMPLARVEIAEITQETSPETYEELVARGTAEWREKLAAERRIYVPVSLPKLPRAHCPCYSLGWGVHGNQIKSPCRKRVLGNGFCQEHQVSHELLQIGAVLGYPEVRVPLKRHGSTVHRVIRSDVAEWESYARISHEECPDAIKSSLAYLRKRFEYQLMPQRVDSCC